jgi:uncharacterized alpha-E superfamily protein
MLSRAAERIYWAARYLERAENTARLTKVYGTLLLDLPEAAGVGWPRLVEITGDASAFEARNKTATDRAVLRFLLADGENPGSVLSSLIAARENFRTSRDLVPREAWQTVNELYLYAGEHLRQAVYQRHRHEVLETVMERCQQVRGLLADSMNHGNAYQFLRIGRSLERADMTTRIIDVAAATLLNRRKDLDPYRNSLWIAVLRSLSAYQMYRQQVRRAIVDREVITFLMTDTRFPRAVGYCLGELDHSLRVLPRYEAALRGVLRLQRITDDLDVGPMTLEDLRAFIDSLQLELSYVHDRIAETWFLPDVPT